MDVTTKRVIILVVLLALLLAVSVFVATTFHPPISEVEESIETTSMQPTLIEETPIFSNYEYVVPITKDDAINQQETLIAEADYLETECERGIYSEPAVAIMREEIYRLYLIVEFLNNDIVRFNNWESEYPVATEVWYYLRNKGYSEEVASGIIGNMMVETGGRTLKLKPKLYSSSKGFYGICQWSMKYFPKVKDKNLDYQLDFLSKTIEKEFKTFGKCYKKGFTYEDFLALESPEQSALAFAKVYERCASGGYARRQRCARAAYEYFASEGAIS